MVKGGIDFPMMVNSFVDECNFVAMSFVKEVALTQRSSDGKPRLPSFFCEKELVGDAVECEHCIEGALLLDAIVASTLWILRCRRRLSSSRTSWTNCRAAWSS